MDVQVYMGTGLDEDTTALCAQSARNGIDALQVKRRRQRPAGETFPKEPMGVMRITSVWVVAGVVWNPASSESSRRSRGKSERAPSSSSIWAATASGTFLIGVNPKSCRIQRPPSSVAVHVSHCGPQVTCPARAVDLKDWIVSPSGRLSSRRAGDPISLDYQIPRTTRHSPIE